MPKRPCARFPQCAKLVERKGLCEDCEAKRPPVVKPWAHLYNYRWQVESRQFREREENAVCGGYPKGVHGEVIVATTDVDHVRPHRGDRALFWDKGNWQALCHVCHSSKTVREDGGFGGVACSRGARVRGGSR